MAGNKKAVTAMDRIDEMLAKMSPEELKKLDKIAAEELAKPWLPTPGVQLDAYLSKANLLLYGGAAGGGKGLKRSVNILTPFGFKELGRLKVGSNICATDGTAQQILAFYERGTQPLYRLTWSDNTETTCDADHIWLGWRTGKSRKIANERSHGEDAASKWLTKDIAAYYAAAEGNVRFNRFAIPVMSAPCVFNVHGEQRGPYKHISRSLPPYIVGVLLGDGSLSSGDVLFCSADSEIPDRVNALLEEAYGQTSAWYINEKGECQSFRVPDDPCKRHLEDLGLIGHRAETKFVPRIYLLASVEERWELLRGLMDTDGWVDEDGDSYFCSTSRQLCEDVTFLAKSLGAIVTWREKFPTYTYNGEKKIGQLAWTLRIKMQNPSRMFHLSRKKERCLNKQPQSMGLYLDKIERCGEEETVCIVVSHPNSLFIIDDFIVTHNTDLICGLALTEHKRSVVFRSQSTDLNGFWERLEILCPQTTSRNSNLKRMVTLDQRMVECGHLDGPGSERAWQGRRHDFVAFDEAATIDARKINFVLGWLAPSEDAPHCRAVLATNPPIGAEGAYLMEWFAPWLDPFYPNPAQTGELRWAIAIGDEAEIKTIWVDGPETIYLNADLSWRLATQEEIDERPRLKQINKPLSRTFIPALLDDNPYLRDTDYRSQLQAKPEPLRSQLLHGSFLAGREDDEWQLIPSEWIRAAQKRWQAPRGKVMIAMGVDVAQGGIHKSTIAPLYDGNVFDKVLSWPGVETPDGKSLADKIILYRRDGANIAIDMTGGYGGSARDHLWHNHQIKIFPIVFSAAGPGGDSQTGYSFFNLRAKMYWQFRIALDPSKSGTAGYVDVALPPGDRILAQLSAPRWKPRSGKIVIEAKEDIQERLGSSPDEADAIVEAWHVRNMKTKALSEGSSNHRSLGEFNSRSARLSWMG